MKSSMEALGEGGARNARAQVVTLALVLGLWATSVLVSQNTAPAPPAVAASGVALAEPGTADPSKSHR